MQTCRIPALLFVVGGILAASTTGAQDWRGKARVDGWVKDVNGQPIAAATVELSRENGGGSSTTTNAKGYWALLGLAEGSWNVNVSAPGYERRSLTIGLSNAGRLPPIEIQLEPAAAPVGAAAAPGQTAQAVKAAVEEGNRLLAEKKYAPARAQYEKALAVVADNAALLKGIAQTYQGEGNRAKAIETLRKIPQGGPSDNDSRLMLAGLLLEEGRLEEGQSLLDQVPPGSVKDSAVYRNAGVLFLDRNNPAQAQLYLTKAIEIEPAKPEAFYYRGQAYWKGKKNAEAKADFKRYLELAPEGPEAKEAREALQALK